MKHLFKISLINLFIFLFGSFSYAQNSGDPSNGGNGINKQSFKIVNNNQSDKEDFYISSILKADMEQYRLRDQETVLRFDNGFDLVLISAKQLFILDNRINPSLYPTEYPMATYTLPNFFITDNGMIKAKNNQSFKVGRSTAK